MLERVNVSADIWQWVQNTLNFSFLKDSIRGKLEEWVSGDKQPTFNQLEDFSKSTRIPLGYFFLETPPEESYPVLEYRTINSIALDNPSRDLLDTISQMERIQEWMREYLIDLDAQPVKYIGSLNQNETAINIAHELRSILSLSETWYEEVKNKDDAFVMIRTTIQGIGILVMQNGVVGKGTKRPLSLSEFRAFTLIDNFAPLIFLNSRDNAGSRLFSLLHEFVHIGLGRNSLFNVPKWYVDPIETFCNKAVAEIIVPERQFRDVWGKSIVDLRGNVDRVARHYRCSHSVVARRAYDFKLISHSDYQQLMDFAKTIAKNNEANKKESSGGPDPLRLMRSRLDSRFLSALTSSLKEGRTLYTEALKLTNANRSTLDLYETEMRGGKI